MTTLLAALLLAAAAPPPAKAPAAPSASAPKTARPKILVLGVEAPKLPAEQVKGLNAELVSAVEKLSRFEVFRSTAAALPDPARKGARPGEPCEVTAPCLEDSAAAEVDRTVSASAGPLGAGWTLRLRVVDEKNARVEAKSSVEVASPAALPEAIRTAVPKLFESVR